jgi:hypothetical protein
MDRAPHYLRVVQALALVAGFGPVAIVAGVTVEGCNGSSGAPGAYCPAEGCGGDTDGGGVAGYDDGSVADVGFAGIVAPPADAGGGSEDAGVSGPCVGFMGGICIVDSGAVILADASDAAPDATVADGSTDAAADATPDVATDGGPLPPPDLPA